MPQTPTTARRWRLLITPPMSGAWNMAIDQALADLYPAQRQATLRFYRWDPPCLSLGLAQRLERDVDLAACAARGITIVRRPTGGRAILHDREVTYALVTAVDDPLVGGATIVQSYLAISRAIIAGLRRLGLTPELAPRPATRHSKSAACFDQPGEYEITVGGRKLVGSAQARQRGVLLQHGSILLQADSTTLAAVLRLPPALAGGALRAQLVALNELLEQPPTFQSVVEALVQGFEAHWSIRLEPGTLTAAEQARAAELVRTKYDHPAWTARR
ncbi:lipoate--protein ligase family protein [Kallotenue papyrolyticum]|uniref:lipoate--protein ligase family protein n=1 Tax=Kallotenue papyrolyticum TaxID=1325125 RepID=UPI00047855E8|nr:lipoate--protein ligase family protein [Kallotenue papyrolyticum]